MTKKEGFLAAVRGDTPDVVPVAPLIHQRFAHKMLGRQGLEAVFEVHQMIGSVHHRGPLGVGVRSSLPEGYGETSREIEPFTSFEGKLREESGNATIRCSPRFA